jgi:hypothetical protein
MSIKVKMAKTGCAYRRHSDPTSAHLTLCMSKWSYCALGTRQAHKAGLVGCHRSASAELSFKSAKLNQPFKSDCYKFIHLCNVQMYDQSVALLITLR